MKKPPPSIAVERQKAIYVNGLGGQNPDVPVKYELLEAKARAALRKTAFAYIAGGAGQEATMRNNRDGFEKWKIWPRMMRDVSARDTSIELFSQKLPTPILLSPIGVLELAHKEADIGVAKAASKLGTPMIFSNQASTAMESCAAVMGASPRWFQLYWSKSNELVKSLVQRAETCGCTAIVVTLDTTLLGWREQDLDLAYLPFLRGMGIAQYTSDPIFQQLLEQPEPPDISPQKPKVNLETLSNVISLMRKYPGSTLGNFKSKLPLKAVKLFINIYSRPSLNWSDLAFLREITKLPILLKGILHPDDARLAIEHGVDGLIVSNHGGRQVDGAVSSIEVLPGVVEAVGGKVPVLMDSGIRGGADIFKALALGAKAVCIGRPYAYGLAIAGAAGVEAVISNLMADFELTMGLSGCCSIKDISKSALFSDR